MKTNDQEHSSLQKKKGEMNVSFRTKMYSDSNGVDLQRALDDRRLKTTTRTSYCNWTSGCSNEPTLKLGATEIQNENTAEKSIYTVLNMIDKPRPSVRERRRNTLPTLPVWEPQPRSRKTLSLSEVDETEVINGTLTTTLCSTEL